ncbi:MAG TPA: hypothetical protein VKG24_16350 [Pseudolabrys sp.]|nr:hypothetical protein [Pseudolabrys sp.]
MLASDSIQVTPIERAAFGQAMSFRNSITIVASPRPRVGKTLLARLVTDFHRQESRSIAAFDLNFGERTLTQFLPEYATTATVRDISGQMALFDRLVVEDGTTKIVDLGHESFEFFFTLAHQIGFVEEAQRRSIAVAILFTVTPDQTSIEAYRKLRERFAQATLTPVHNEILGPAQHRDKYPLAGGGQVMMRIPVLAPGLRRYIETPPFSFADSNMSNAVCVPLDVHAELQRWLRRIYLEFRELDLRILLADLQASMRIGS